MKVKVKALLPADLRCKGRIKAEGKKVKPVFCWREKLIREDGWGKHTGVELHSRITGKPIGYLGHQQEFVTDPAKAWTVDKLNASLLPMHVRFFLNAAQSKAKHNAEDRESLRAIIKAAKASK